MNCKILINAVNPEQVRIARVVDSRLEEFHIETTAREITHGNIYKGVITRIEPSLQAAFVDYGAERHGFLQKNEIHPDYYQDTESGERGIDHLVKRNQQLLVQVVKDPVMKKGAMLTTFISLAGRCVVLMPGTESKGVSRKIEDEAERSRLREILDSIKLPEGFGLIARTAGVGCTKTQITHDYNYLQKLWRNIKSNVMKAETPSLLYKERNLVQRSLRDYLTADVSEILIDDPVVFKDAKDFMDLIAPKQAKLIKLYQGAKPIFSKHQLEEQIASIYENRVELKSGGSIVISQTEALVAIDVNSGKATQNRNIEQTAFITNQEAVEEIARQLRMRDLGGLIVVDLIDMRDAKHKSEVEKALKNHMRQDKAKTKIGRISAFGLLEMSRQRLRPSIEFGSFEPCPYCGGKGLTPSTETLGLSFLRQLNLEALKADTRALKGIVPPPVAEYLLNRKRRELYDLESRHEIAIAIVGDPGMFPGQSQIVADREPAKNSTGPMPITI
jgi:ribonuclease E